MQSMTAGNPVTVSIFSPRYTNTALDRECAQSPEGKNASLPVVHIRQVVIHFFLVNGSLDIREKRQVLYKFPKIDTVRENTFHIAVQTDTSTVLRVVLNVTASFGC